MTDKDFVRKFRFIKVGIICKKLNINKSNIGSGRASEKLYKKVREEIEHEIAKLYLKEGEK